MSRARYEKLISERKRELEQQVMKLPLDASHSKLAFVQGQYNAFDQALDIYRQSHRNDEDGAGL